MHVGQECEVVDEKTDYGAVNICHLKIKTDFSLPSSYKYKMLFLYY